VSRPQTGRNNPAGFVGDTGPVIPGIQLLIAGLPLFSELGMADIARIAAGCREKSLAKGDVLFHKGDAPRGIYVVLSGQIKLAFPSTRGVEKVVDIVGPRQSFGEAPVFTERPFPVTAEALTDTRVVMVSSGVLLDLIDGDRAFARKMLAGLSMRLHSLVQDVEAYSLRSSMQRVVGFLLEQGADAVAVAPGGEIELPATKQVIASRLNLTPETLSRVFNALSGAGLITVSGKQVTIHDIRRLRDHQL